MTHIFRMRLALPPKLHELLGRLCRHAQEASCLGWAAACHRMTGMVRAGFGFAVWVIGSVGCAMAPSFWVLILCRVVMGAGEASIITLSNPFIDDVAPPAQKTLWFGILNLVSCSTPFRASPRVATTLSHVLVTSSLTRVQMLGIDSACSAVCSSQPLA